MRRLMMFAALAMLVATPDAQAQNDGLTCDGSAWDTSSDWRLAALGAPDLSVLKTSSEWKFAFDPKRYAFDSIQFYVNEVGPFDEIMGGNVGPVEMIIRIGGDRPSWFRVVPNTNPRGEQLIGSQGTATSAGKRDVEPMVRQIDPLGGEPIFALDVQQLSTSAQIHTKFVVDLRNNRRRVPLAFTCVFDRIAGACGAYDNQYQFAGESIDCKWNRDERELYCSAATGVETHWGSRSGTREFPLPGQRDRSATIRAASASQVEQLAVAFAGTAKAASVRTAEWGVVHTLAVVPGRGSRSIVLLGAQGMSASFGARFLAVILAPNTKPVLTFINTRNLSRRPWVDESDVSDVTIHARPEPADVVFQVERIASALPALLRVRVSEGDVRAAYLVGIDDRGARPIMDALRTATNTVDYFACMRAVTTPNAVSVKLVPGNKLTIDLDVEPPRQVDINTFAPIARDNDFVIDFGSSPFCRTSVRVTWGAGFFIGVRESPLDCEASPARFVDIKDNGEVALVKQLKPRQ